MEQIKHFRITYGEEEDAPDRYICNLATKINPEKATRKKEEVTCKNCLRKLAKHPVYMQRIRFKVVEELE